MQELSSWQRLTSVATLGTRRTGTPESLGWPDAQLAAASEQVNTELALLRAAAARHLYELAGTRPASSGATIPEPPRDAQQTYLNEAAALRLIRMIGGEEPQLAPEWFRLATATGRALPAHFAPAVLSAFEPKDDQGLGPTLGTFGAWLANFKPEWRAKLQVKQPSQERWQDGSLEERCAELAAMRRLDPKQAREWLEATWDSEPPEARESFLTALTIGLSMEDEAFLERALDDKRKAVRSAAVECLARLPDSAHAKRNLARLEPLVRLTDKKSGLMGKLSKRKLNIELPQSIDKTAQRDGVELKVPAQLKMGERSFWLIQMAALAPPAYWTSRFNARPEEFLEAVAESDFAKELLEALSDAVIRLPDESWLAALCDAWLRSSHPLHESCQIFGKLVSAAPESQRSELLEKLVSKHEGSNDLMAALGYLRELRFQWSNRLTRKIFEGIGPRVRAEHGYSQGRSYFEPVGYCCDVDAAMTVLPHLLETTPPQSSWRAALERLSDLVEFRAAMKRELT